MSVPKQALLKRLQLQQQRSKEAYAEFEVRRSPTPITVFSFFNNNLRKYSHVSLTSPTVPFSLVAEVGGRHASSAARQAKVVRARIGRQCGRAQTWRATPCFDRSGCSEEIKKRELCTSAVVQSRRGAAQSFAKSLLGKIERGSLSLPE